MTTAHPNSAQGETTDRLVPRLRNLRLRLESALANRTEEGDPEAASWLSDGVLALNIAVDRVGVGNVMEALWRDSEAECERQASGLRPSDAAIAQAFHEHRMEGDLRLPPWSEVQEDSGIWQYSHNFAARLAALPVTVPASPALPQDAAPPLGEEVRRLAGLLVSEIGHLIDESEGVAGLHRNGDLAPWEELVPGGRYERLTSLDELRTALTLQATSPAQVAPVDGGQTQAAHPNVDRVLAGLSGALESDVIRQSDGLLVGDLRALVAALVVAQNDIVDLETALSTTPASAGDGDLRAAEALYTAWRHENWLRAGCYVDAAWADLSEPVRASWKRIALARPAPQAPAASPERNTDWDGHILESAIDLARERAALAPTAKPEPAGREEIAPEDLARAICDVRGFAYEPDRMGDGSHAFYSSGEAYEEALALSRHPILAVRLGAEGVAGEERIPQSAFVRGIRVRKISGSSWHGTVCGHYSTDMTPDGVCVESEREPGSVQLYPTKALSPATAPATPIDGGTP